MSKTNMIKGEKNQIYSLSREVLWTQASMKSYPATSAEGKILPGDLSVAMAVIPLTFYPASQVYVRSLQI